MASRPPVGVRTNPETYCRFVRRVDHWLFFGDPRGAEWAPKLPGLADKHPPAIQARGWVMRGSHLRRIKDFSGAEDSYATACRLSPGDGWVLARVCILDLERGRLSEAQETVERAIPILSGEDRAVALTNRGLVRVMSGDSQGAVDDFSAAIRHSEPKWPVVTAAVINLGAALSLAGPFAAAHALDVVHFAKGLIQGQAHRALLRNRLLWIEALAWFALDPEHQRDRAARKLRRVIARARKLGASTDAALAALDHREITGGPRERQGRVMGWPAGTTSTGIDLAAQMEEIIGDMPADTDRAAVATLHKLLKQARAGAELAQLAELRGPLARASQRRVR